jgi:hypothetical protein
MAVEIRARQLSGTRRRFVPPPTERWGTFEDAMDHLRGVHVHPIEWASVLSDEERACGTLARGWCPATCTAYVVVQVRE